MVMVYGLEKGQIKSRLNGCSWLKNRKKQKKQTGPNKLSIGSAITLENG